MAGEVHTVVQDAEHVNDAVSTDSVDQQMARLLSFMGKMEGA